MASVPGASVVPRVRKRTKMVMALGRYRSNLLRLFNAPMLRVGFRINRAQVTHQPSKHRRTVHASEVLALTTKGGACLSSGALRNAERYGLAPTLYRRVSAKELA